MSDDIHQRRLDFLARNVLAAQAPVIAYDLTELAKLTPPHNGGTNIGRIDDLNGYFRDKLKFDAMGFQPFKHRKA